MIFSTVFGPHEPALTVGIVGHQAHRPAGDRGHAGDHAVGAEAVLLPVGQQGVLGERALVHQTGHPLAHRELALLLGLGVMAVRAAGAGLLERVIQILHGWQSRGSRRR